MRRRTDPRRPEKSACVTCPYSPPQDLYTSPLLLCGFGAGAAAALVAAAEHPALFAGVILCELWSPSDAPRDALSFAYGQAAEFATPRQAAAFLSASCWVLRPHLF